MQAQSQSETIELMPRICDDGCASGPMKFALADAPTAQLELEDERPSSSSSPAVAAAVGDVFLAPVVVERPDPSTLVTAPVGQAGAGGGPAPRRKGLSPYMLAKNKRVHAAREAKGRRMTLQEYDGVVESFKARWQRTLAESDLSVERDSYQDWRDGPPDGNNGDDDGKTGGVAVKPYKTSWSCGCRSTPITKHELHRHITTVGWPSDAVCTDGGDNDAILKPNGFNYAAWNDYSFWGYGRHPRNSDRDSLENPKKFENVEKNIHSYIRSLGKEIADAGTELIMVEGTSVAPPHSKVRNVCFVTGTCYNPQVFDVTNCSFFFEDDGVDSSVPELPLPFLVSLDTRFCRVSSNFVVLDCQTSDEFIWELVRSMRAASLYHLDYETVSYDGSLKWSEVHGIRFVTELFDGEASRPPKAPPRAKKRKTPTDGLLSGDPFAEPAAPKPKAARGPRGAARGNLTGHGGPPAAGRAMMGAPRPPLPAAEAAPGGPPPSVGEVAQAADEFEAKEASDLDKASDESDLFQEGSDQDLSGDEVDGSAVVDPPPSGAVEGVLAGAGIDDGKSDDDEDLTDKIVEGVAAAADDVGLMSAAANPDISGPTSATDPPTSAAANPDISGRRDPWQELDGPSDAGYMNYRGRLAGRLVKGKTRGGVHVCCYFHTQCSLMISDRLYPGDETIKKWLFEVPPNPEKATAATKKDLRKQHLDIAKSRWQTARGQARATR